MQVQLAILEKYPELTPAPFGSDFVVLDNELVQWNASSHPQPTEDELEAAWLSAVKKAKVAEFEQSARQASSAVMLDALVELAGTPRSGPVPNQPNVATLKDVQARLGRARSAAQAVSPSQHGNDPLKAANAVENLKWEEM